MTGAEPLIWVLVDPRAGTANQALGVADKLGLAFVEKPLDYNSFARLPNFGASLRALTAASKAIIEPPWPDMVIAAGRRAAAVARYIRKQSPSTRLVQIMDPGGSLSGFDLVAIPSHDNPPAAENILPVTGAPHRLNADDLKAAGQEWIDRFEGMPRPWIAVLVGGATKRKPFPPSLAARLAKSVAALADTVGGSLLVSTSRRTGASIDAFSAELPPASYLYRYDDPGPNPYRGLLALADGIVVTGDSVSMVCEACAPGVPVWIFSPPGFAIEKHEALHRDLCARGSARPFSDEWTDWQAAPLDEAARIAGRARQLLDLRDDG
ncbi:MAG: mitochondrial fission ELM1 family protein [Rhodospirillales bacterium]